jgi:NAD(P)-dependent dehydrogenase (short-subunit alcohol dehydrogenase family)
VIATGFLHDEANRPERSLRDLLSQSLRQGLRHQHHRPRPGPQAFHPLLPREGRAVVAVLSAKVGSIGDNQLGGWHAYRASKAALNQIVRTASVECEAHAPRGDLCRASPRHGRHETLGAFLKAGLNVRPPEEAAADLLRVIDGLTPAQTG